MNDTTKKGPPTALFFAGTGIYAIFILGLAWRFGYFDPNGTPIDPNELGDVLAGAFSPLAFWWLLYASLSQRAQLELQAEELRQNNVTQEQQRVEMSKQVAALQAQTEMLQAQATATYDPIFVMRTSMTTSGDGGDHIISLTIENLGGDVINVTATRGVNPHTIRHGLEQPGRTIQGGVIAHWPRESKVIFMCDSSEFDNSQAEIVLSFQRLDTIRKANRYAIKDNGLRLELLSSHTDRIPIDSAF